MLIVYKAGEVEWVFQWINPGPKETGQIYRHFAYPLFWGGENDDLYQIDPALTTINEWCGCGFKNGCGFVIAYPLQCSSYSPVIIV